MSFLPRQYIYVKPTIVACPTFSYSELRCQYPLTGDEQLLVVILTEE